MYLAITYIFLVVNVTDDNCVNEHARLTSVRKSDTGNVTIAYVHSC